MCYEFDSFVVVVVVCVCLCVCVYELQFCSHVSLTSFTRNSTDQIALLSYYYLYIIVVGQDQLAKATDLVVDFTYTDTLTPTHYTTTI